MTTGGEPGPVRTDRGWRPKRREQPALQRLSEVPRAAPDVAANLRMVHNGMSSTTSSTVRCASSSSTFFESPLAPPPASTAGPCQPAPDSFRVNCPTLSTTFHPLLKAATVVDRGGPQTRQRLDHIAVEKHQIEVSDRFDRDVSEDAAVGAYSAAIDGERREQARQMDSRKIADADVLGLAGDVDA